MIALAHNSQHKHSYRYSQRYVPSERMKQARAALSEMNHDPKLMEAVHQYESNQSDSRRFLKTRTLTAQRCVLCNGRHMSQFRLCTACLGVYKKDFRVN